MPKYRGPRIDATILGAASLLALALGSGAGAVEPTERFQTIAPPAAAQSESSAYVGVWASADDTVRLDVSPDGSYERSIVGRRKSARGLYKIVGTTLELRDESGVRTTVTSDGHYLEMAGYQLSRI